MKRRTIVVTFLMIVAIFCLLFLAVTTEQTIVIVDKNGQIVTILPTFELFKRIAKQHCNWTDEQMKAAYYCMIRNELNSRHIDINQLRK